jgi:hypothetical protein
VERAKAPHRCFSFTSKTSDSKLKQYLVSKVDKALLAQLFSGVKQELGHVSAFAV